MGGRLLGLVGIKAVMGWVESLPRIIFQAA